MNGIDVEVLEKAIRMVSEQYGEPNRRRQMNLRRSRASWRGGMRSLVRAGAGRFEVDEDPSGPSNTPTSLEYLLGALGACVLLTFVYVATRRNVRVDDVEVAVEGELGDLMTYLGLSDEGDPGFVRISLTCYVRSDADENLLREIFSESLRRSPVLRTFMREVELSANLRTLK
ncbi:MAG: OsmC family protein [Thaumarchaeota archaeon]|nr:OsmC family protein [Candidatus Calditenuaceae archaeon]MDW8042507.1 OsmC family protein [Nitrososphaerota archaeon]